MQKSSFVINFIAIGFLILLITPLTILKAEGSDYNGYNTKLQIISGKNKKIHDFFVKIATDEKTRERGLMFINYLPENYAMLFEFEKEQQIFMWMKNTKIPLDMIFIDKNNRVVAIKNQAKPKSLDIIPSEKKAIRVLEVNGGICKKLEIDIGDLIKY